MQIKKYNPVYPKIPTRAPQITEKMKSPAQHDSMEWGTTRFQQDLSSFGEGAAYGAVGIGGPSSLGMAAIKAFSSGSPSWGTALGVAAVATSAVAVLPGLFVLGYADIGNSHSPFTGGYLAGAALTTGLAATAIF